MHGEEAALAVLPRDSEHENNQGSAGPSVDSLSPEDRLDNLPRNATPTLIEGLEETSFSDYDDGGNWAARSRIGLEDFDFLATIGKGTSSKIMLAEKKASKGLFAIKVIKKELIIEQDEVSRLRVEKNVLLKATQEKHPFIVHLHASCQTETRLYFVMEYVSGGDLMFHAQRGPFGMEIAQ